MYRFALCALALAATPAFAASPTVVTPPTLSSDAAYKVMAYAQKTGAARGYANCVAIDDANGNLLAFYRSGNTAPGCIAAAMAKARSASSNGVDTRHFYDLAKDQNVALGFIPGILPAVAGVNIHYKGKVIGSVGVAGGPSDAEEEKFAAELRDQAQNGLPK